MVEKFKERLVFKRKAALLGSKKPPYHQEVFEEECDKWAPVEYHGTMTRPLAYFGECQVKTETEKLPWISDNTSGKVHPDMRTISMLFNEDLTLPKVAENFIAQSPVLQEEARWERVKATFYSFYPQVLKRQVFEALKGKLPRNASQVIAMKTLRFENEILLKLRPKPSDQWGETDYSSESVSESECCSEVDATKLNKQLPQLAREHKKRIECAFKRHTSLKKKLSNQNSFFSEELLDRDPSWQSGAWKNDVEGYQKVARTCSGARLLSYSFAHAVARYEPRTGWIHLKTQLLRPGLKENKKLPNEMFEFQIPQNCKIEGNLEARNAAVDTQMALFEAELRISSTGHLATLDSYHNDILLHEYEVSVPYETVKPSLCAQIAKSI